MPFIEHLNVKTALMPFERERAKKIVINLFFVIFLSWIKAHLFHGRTVDQMRKKRIFDFTMKNVEHFCNAISSNWMRIILHTSSKLIYVIQWWYILIIITFFWILMRFFSHKIIVSILGFSVICTNFNFFVLFWSMKFIFRNSIRSI